MPDIDGLSTFAGPSFHSARWEHEHDLRGRRVAVIGTGASAAQIVPELAQVCAQVDVYQRTPQWIMPRKDVVFTEEEKERFARDPEAMAKHREEIFWGFENTIAFRVDDDGAAPLEALARNHIDYRITDEELRAKLTPDYPFGCKRTLVCSDFYKALLRKNVELMTDPIDHVTPGGVVSADGTERAADVIVLATGFKATEYLEGIDVVGLGRRRLHEDWSEVAHAYLGLTVSGYPEFLHALRPQHQPGRQLDHRHPRSPGRLRRRRAARPWRPRGSMPSRCAASVMDAYNRDLAEALDGHAVAARMPELLQERQRTHRHPTAPDFPVVRRANQGVPTRGVRTRMKAAVYYETGAPDVFRYEEVPDPVVGPGDILIDVEAVSIEGGDTLNRLGGDLARVPHVVGYQCAGTVAEVGPAVRNFAVGDRAVTVGLDGSHAERRAVPEGFAWKIPDGVSTDEAACVPVPFGTADDCLFEFGRLQASETALIHAGAGGVGIAAIQMAKRAGARVFATASSDQRLERLTRARARRGHQLRHRTTSWPRPRRLTDGRGVDVIVDSVGGTTLQGSIAALAYRGRCVTVGDAGRAPAEQLDISTMRPNNQTLSGYFLGAELLLHPERAHADDRPPPQRHRPGRASVVIDRAFPLSDAAGRTPTSRAARRSAGCCSSRKRARALVHRQPMFADHLCNRGRGRSDNRVPGKWAKPRASSAVRRIPRTVATELNPGGSAIGD